MSSTKHQPNSRKRPISLVQPEFPSLPNNESLVAARAFAENSQKALLSIELNESFMFLPLISPHQLQQRFNVDDDNSVLVVARKSYLVLKEELENLKKRDYSGIYVW